jgi:uncharacterized protein with FMN-binding domain
MKRFLLIAAGTIGGLGAVLSITPPQLGATNLGLGLDLGTPPNSNTLTQTPTASQSTSATVAPVATTKPSASSTKNSVPTKTPSSTTSVPATASETPAQSTAPTVAPTPTSIPVPTKTATPTPTVKSNSGTFTGPVVNVNYGNVQVEITVVNGKITDAQALMAPTGRNDKYTRMALPQLKQQTLAAQSTTIQGASGASYTTYGWRKSLQGAMVKAGL